MAISVQKTIPSTSDWYSGGGDTTITLAGTTKIILHSKKEVIKINRRKNKSRQASEDSDKFDNQVKDLKNGFDDIVISGWIEDEEGGDTAWTKYWKLRAMCSRGGPLTNLTIENVEFDSGTQQAFLEDVKGTVNGSGTGVINVAAGKDVPRIELVLTFFVGNER